MLRRKILSVALISLLSLSALGFTARRTVTGTTPSPAKFSVTLTFKFGKRLPNEKCGPGRGICELKLGFSPFSAAQVNATASTNDDNDKKLELTFGGKLPEGSSTFFVDRDITVDSAIAQKLGFKSLTILSGEYSVASGKGSFGGVDLNVRSTK